MRKEEETRKRKISWLIPKNQGITSEIKKDFNFRKKKSKIDEYDLDLTKNITTYLEENCIELLIYKFEQCSEKKLARLMVRTNYCVFDWALKHEHVKLISCLLKKLPEKNIFLMVTHEECLAFKQFITKNLRILKVNTISPSKAFITITNLIMYYNSEKWEFIELVHSLIEKEKLSQIKLNLLIRKLPLLNQRKLSLNTTFRDSEISIINIKNDDSRSIEIKKRVTDIKNVKKYKKKSKTKKMIQHNLKLKEIILSHLKENCIDLLIYKLKPYSKNRLAQLMSITDYYTFDWALEHEHVKLINFLLKKLPQSSIFQMLHHQEFLTFKRFLTKNLQAFKKNLVNPSKTFITIINLMITHNGKNRKFTRLIHCLVKEQKLPHNKLELLIKKIPTLVESQISLNMKSQNNIKSLSNTKNNNYNTIFKVTNDDQLSNKEKTSVNNNTNHDAEAPFLSKRLKSTLP